MKLIGDQMAHLHRGVAASLLANPVRPAAGKDIYAALFHHFG
ncbi:MAG TPA: hypothetical protein VGR47_21415 [Terracidiphilus sp.]|nr:hypothetical protein [Terracidiphilus sp.]